MKADRKSEKYWLYQLEIRYYNEFYMVNVCILLHQPKNMKTEIENIHSTVDLIFKYTQYTYIYNFIL